MTRDAARIVRAAYATTSRGGCYKDSNGKKDGLMRDIYMRIFAACMRNEGYLILTAKDMQENVARRLQNRGFKLETTTKNDVVQIKVIFGADELGKTPQVDAPQQLTLTTDIP